MNVKITASPEIGFVLVPRFIRQKLLEKNRPDIVFEEGMDLDGLLDNLPPNTQSDDRFIIVGRERKSVTFYFGGVLQGNPQEGYSTHDCMYGVRTLEPGDNIYIHR